MKGSRVAELTRPALLDLKGQRGLANGLRRRLFSLRGPFKPVSFVSKPLIVFFWTLASGARCVLSLSHLEERFLGSFKKEAPKGSTAGVLFRV